MAETGSEMSITNSNSNFGAKALVAEGFKKNAFSQDDVGYITHIIPPKEFSTLDKTVEFQTLDISTTVGVGTTAFRLARVDIAANETFFFEPNYPIVMTHDESLVVEVTAPAAVVGGTGIGSAINYQILGDTDI